MRSGTLGSSPSSPQPVPSPYNTSAAGHTQQSGSFYDISIDPNRPRSTAPAAHQHQPDVSESNRTAGGSITGKKSYNWAYRHYQSKKKAFQKASLLGRFWMIFKYLLYLGILVLICVALSKLVLWVVKLMELRKYLDDTMAQFKEWQDKIEDFYHKVTDKFKDWLGDGKQLADNVQEKGKGVVNGLIDKLNGNLGKFKINIDHLDKREVHTVRVGGRWVASVTPREAIPKQLSGVANTVPLAIAAVTGIPNVKRSDALKNVSHLFDGDDEVAPTTMTTSTFTPVQTNSSNNTSAIASMRPESNGALKTHGSIPVPFALLAGLARLMRRKQHLHIVVPSSATQQGAIWQEKSFEKPTSGMGDNEKRRGPCRYDVHGAQSYDDGFPIDFTFDYHNMCPVCLLPQALIQEHVEVEDKE